MLAYFDEALDAALGIVHRPWFESRLRARFAGAADDADPAWNALRNIVYATGCRIELSKTRSIRDANQAAWGWFENALSVHTELLYFRTSITGVKALTLMVSFKNWDLPSDLTYHRRIIPTISEVLVLSTCFARMHYALPLRKVSTGNLQVRCTSASKRRIKEVVSSGVYIVSKNRFQVNQDAARFVHANVD